MIRLAVTFFIAGLIGLLIQATMLHSVSPTIIAPDVILMLVIFIGLSYQSALGAVGSFALGILADFASGKYVGPNASGCLFAFLLVVVVSKKVYAERWVAVTILSFFCSIFKSLTYISLMATYVSSSFFAGTELRRMFFEALLTALFAPIVLKAMHWFSAQSSFGRFRRNEIGRRLLKVR